MLQDCIAALRAFRRNPLLTATAVLCLATGIGGTTAVFSVVDGVLLRSLPYPGADRLVLLRTEYFENDLNEGRVSEPELRDWQAGAKSFEAIAGYRYFGFDLIDPERSERLRGLWVSPEFFSVLGIQTAAGRAFRPGDPPTMILGRRLWEQRFAFDSSIVGRTIPIGICCPQQPRSVPIYVTGAVNRDVPFPPTVRGLRDRGHGVNDAIDYWWPVNLSTAKRPSERNTEAVAKLKAGVTVAQAQAEMDAVARQLEESFPATNRGWTIRVVPIGEELFAGIRPALLLLMGAAAFVLLIACANVAVLLTFRAISRFHEIAVRAALGAGAGRLIRQLVTESLLLTLFGGAAGLLVAEAVKRFLIALAPADLPRLNQVSLDARVLVFALLTTISCGVVVGLIPALRVLRFDLDSTLRTEGSRTATTHRRARTYEPLLVAQVSLTLALLIGSGLMIKSLNRLLGVSAGFEPTNLMTVTLSLPYAKHAWSYNARFSERVVEQIERVAGVEAAGAIRGFPMSETRFEGRFHRWDRPPADASQRAVGRLRVVSPGYFRAMRVPLLAGREFSRQDGVGAIGDTNVIIINDAMARWLWPGENPIGQKVVSADVGKTPVEVIGVAGDVRYTSMDTEPIPEVYLPDGLFPQDEVGIVFRTASDPAAMTEAIRRAINEVERDVFIGPFRTMDEVIAESLSQRRFMMVLLSVFSATGLLLAVAGIAGIVAYSLSLRIREVGIRVAMGAGPRDVILLISRQGLAPAAIGLAAGSLLALGVTRLLTHMLYTVSPRDPVVFVSAIAAVAGVSVFAAAISAYRACRVDAASILK